MTELPAHGRGTVYNLPGQSLPTPEQVFGVSIPPIGIGTASSDDLAAYSDDFEGSSDDYPISSDDMAPDSDDLDRHAGEADELGRLLSPSLTAPAIDRLDTLKPEYRRKLQDIARLPRQKKRVSQREMREVILALCEGQYITRSCLAELVCRTADALRQQYLRDMISDKLLTMAFPQSPNHKRQAYIATASLRARADAISSEGK